MKTEAEKREYQRGYNRGRARVAGYASRAFRIAERFRNMMRAAERAALGRDNWRSRECQNCERWTRGGDGKPNYKWGICRADFMSEVGESWMGAVSQISTHEGFGCVSHLDSNPLRAPTSAVNPTVTNKEG